MSRLERALHNAEREIDKVPTTKPSAKNVRVSGRLVLLAAVAATTFLVFDTLASWLFGVPDETVQADVIKLLQYTDSKLQRDYAATGSYPLQLPADAPSQLVTFKRTLAGYKLDARIHDIHVLLERNGDQTRAKRID